MSCNGACMHPKKKFRVHVHSFIASSAVHLAHQSFAISNPIRNCTSLSFYYPNNSNRCNITSLPGSTIKLVFTGHELKMICPGQKAPCSLNTFSPKKPTQHGSNFLQRVYLCSPFYCARVPLIGKGSKY